MSGRGYSKKQRTAIRVKLKQLLGTAKREIKKHNMDLSHAIKYLIDEKKENIRGAINSNEEGKVGIILTENDFKNAGWNAEIDRLKKLRRQEIRANIAAAEAARKKKEVIARMINDQPPPGGWDEEGQLSEQEKKAFRGGKRKTRRKRKKKTKRRKTKRRGEGINKHIENYVNELNKDNTNKKELEKHKNLYLNAYARHMKVPRKTVFGWDNKKILRSFDKRVENEKQSRREAEERERREQEEIIARNLRRDEVENARKALVYKKLGMEKERQQQHDNLNIRELQGRYLRATGSAVIPEDKMPETEASRYVKRKEETRRRGPSKLRGGKRTRRRRKSKRRRKLKKKH